MRIPIRKGWCPSLHAPMQTHDGWLVRVTPDLEGLTPAQTAFLADYAQYYGNGRVTLTLRGNLQLRGLDEDAARSFSKSAIEHGLGLVDPEQESRRRILFMSPLAGLDPDCAADTVPVARDIERALQHLPAGWRPPEKFSLAVDGGGRVPVGALRADLVLRHEGGDWRLHEGEHVHTPRRECVVDEIMAALLRLETQTTANRALHRLPPFQGTIPALIGPFLPGCFGGVALLGEIGASTCASLAETGAVLRLTPWRGLILDRLFMAPDLITDPDDARRHVMACPGSGRCAQAFAPAQRDALALVPDLRGRNLHVSGCAKGCASRDRHDVTLLARENGYDLIWQGMIKDNPVETGLDIEDVRRRLRQT